MDRSAFYAALRRRDSGLFGTSLSQAQVDGLEALLDALDGFSLHHAAHVLAEVYHETGGGMEPVKETVFRHSKDRNPSDAKVIRRLNLAFAQGKLPWVKRPYWRDGWFGRGMIQLTHEDNYRKASALVGLDLVSNPDLALGFIASAKIAADGCATGMFTGRKLSDYDGGPGGYDHYNARAIVNGDKRANGGKIASYAKAFEAALDAGNWGSEWPPVVLPPDVDDDAMWHPDTAEQPGGWLTALLSAIASIFGGRK